MKRGAAGSLFSHGFAAVLPLALAMFLLAPAFAFGAGAAVQLEDGAYEVPVTLSGGSGRASIESPARVSVSGGSATATVVWSSSNYDKMTVGGADYAPVTTEGGSTFEIPVADDEVRVEAETTAMGTPHTISYTIAFDMACAQAAGSGTGAVPVAALAGIVAALLVAGVVLGAASSRRRARR